MGWLPELFATELKQVVISCICQRKYCHNPDFDNKWDGFNKILQGNLEITTA